MRTNLTERFLATALGAIAIGALLCAAAVMFDLLASLGHFVT